MKTSYSITMDFRRAIQQAEKLEDAERNIQRELNRLSDCRSGIAGSWKGENATAYLKKMQSLEEQLKTSARQIQKAAQTIRVIAKNTYDAEQSALVLARKRGY